MKRLALLMLLLLVSADAFAKVGGLADAPAVRHQNYLRLGRHELTPSLGITMGQTYSTDMLVSAAYQYHFLDYLSAGIQIGYGVTSFKTGVTDSVEAEALGDNEESVVVGRSGLGLVLLGKVDFVPLAGKIVLFDRFLGYADFHISIGGGTATSRFYNWEDAPGFTDSFRGLLMVGGGFRYFPVKLISLNFDVQDLMVFDRPVVSTKASEIAPTHSPTFFFGVSFFLPETKVGF